MTASPSPSARRLDGPHPLAGKPMSGADTIIQVLVDQGVDTIFGYSGGAILPTYDAIFRYNAAHADKQVRLIVPANEQGAGFMAAGYSRASGRVGVAVVTSGPGATNAVTPVRDAMADSIPMILITGQVAKASMGADAFQEAPVYNIMSSCSKHTFLVANPEELEATVRVAFRVALAGRPGPVVIDVPKDVQNWIGPFRGEGDLDYARSYLDRMESLAGAHVPAEAAKTFFELLGRSERPLIYAGGGVIDGAGPEALTAFVDRFGIPVVTTLMGIGAVDSTHPLALHMLGMHGAAYANYAVEDCDFLITVGARFDDRVAGKVSAFAPNARAIAHIDIDAAEIGKVKAVQWSCVSSAATALNDLVAAGKGFKKDFAPWRAHVAELKKTHKFNYDHGSTTILPYQVIECLSELTKGEAVLVTGVGQHQMWSAQYSTVRKPRGFLTSGSMGTMGFGLPTAIGAQAARPDALVIDIDGDGSLRMNQGELETATTYNLPVKVLLMNNLGDGMVRQWQKLYFGERLSGSDKSLHRKDFVKAAEADGYGFRRRLTAYDKDKVKKTLQAFLAHEGPAFLEVMIDPDADVYPMVGPGQGYSEMTTGAFIKSRSAAPKGEGDGAPPSPDASKPSLF
jgi:acetolactate synthase-1/2/3 large subunit